MLAAVSVTVGATSVMVIVMSSVSAAVPSVALTVRRVARGRLEVEVVGVVDGDRARGGADGERQLAVAVPSVLPAVMDQVRLSSSPVVETVTTAALAEADSARLAEVSVTVGATSVIVIVMTSVSVWVARRRPAP